MHPEIDVVALASGVTAYPSMKHWTESMDIVSVSISPGAICKAVLTHGSTGHGKGFDRSAPMSEIRVKAVGHVSKGAVTLTVNKE